MTLVTRIVVNSLQLPADGLTVAEARAKAVQQLGMEPAKSTPDSTESGEVETVQTQPNQGA